MVYLTDLDGSFPPDARERERFLDVLWVVPHRTDRRPPFGRLVQMFERQP